MKTITDLRNELIAVFDGLKSGTITPAVATELNNAAGKIIATTKVQLDYAAQIEEEINVSPIGEKGISPKGEIPETVLRERKARL